jgi:hypothetical protein
VPGPMRLITILVLAASLVVAEGIVPTLSSGQDASQSASQNPQETSAVEFSDEEVSHHRIGQPKAIHLPRSEEWSFFRSVRLNLIVDTEGNVIWVNAEDGPSEASTLAVTEAKTWTYKPFEKDGVPTTAKITDYVRVLPPEDLPKIHQSFPNIRSVDGVVMKLSRSGCFGSCPAYSLEIHGDGTTIYRGNFFVAVTGEHREHLSPDQVNEILDAFRTADYFSLRDEYRASVTDCPTVTTSFQIDQVSKEVTDYVGAEEGMPQSVSDLETTIDRVAGTMKWIHGNERTVAALREEGWDFKSSEAAKVMARAAQEGNSTLVGELMVEGVGLSGSNEDGKSTLAAAVLAGDRETAKMLMKAGAGKDNARIKTEALAAAARTADMELVRQLIDYGAIQRGATKIGTDEAQC